MLGRSQEDGRSRCQCGSRDIKSAVEQQLAARREAASSPPKPSFDVTCTVKDYYGSIASGVLKQPRGGCGCSSSPVGNIATTPAMYDTESLQGLPADAIDASLGCANPLVLAKLKQGEIALDLGSGGGIDVLMAARHVGPTGRVYGLDMTDEMLMLAEANRKKMGVTNVEFLKGYIENIPLPDRSLDVIMSNCVINLSGNKEKVAAEAFRVLKSGGRVAIADKVTLREVPLEVRQRANMWSGCFAGALSIEQYRGFLERAGFRDIEITPVHIYTKELIQDTILANRHLADSVATTDLDVIDGAFAGAYIRAIKE